MSSSLVLSPIFRRQFRWLSGGLARPSLEVPDPAEAFFSPGQNSSQMEFALVISEGWFSEKTCEKNSSWEWFAQHIDGDFGVILEWMIIPYNHCKSLYKSLSGWCFGCHQFYFPIQLGCDDHPIWRTHIFQRGGPTTNQTSMVILWVNPWVQHTICLFLRTVYNRKIFPEKYSLMRTQNYYIMAHHTVLWWFIVYFIIFYSMIFLYLMNTPILLIKETSAQGCAKDLVVPW